MTTLKPTRIRLATPADAPAIASFYAQLGYPADADNVARFQSVILPYPDHGAARLACNLWANNSASRRLGLLDKKQRK
jgi:hypothetical protein